MKLIIQIPCFNEAKQLPETLSCLPRQVPGFHTVEWLVIDDGSTDGTAEVARAGGVDHVVTLTHNQGLAAAFMTGLQGALRRGADVIVNTDADNQYKAEYIPALTSPILEGRAQMVIGERPLRKIGYFSRTKRMLQGLGSWVVRIASGTDVPDAPSGFRAISRDAAVRLYVFSNYTYTLETIIQAGQLGIPIISVKVDVNPATRESRLIRTLGQYLLRSTLTILRISVLYRPFRFFALISFFLALPGLAAFGRFLFFYMFGEGAGHIQSLVIGGALLAISAITFMGGLIADLVAANRRVIAEIRSGQLLAELEAAAAAQRAESAGE